MNDTKLIGRISVVTDSEVPYSNIGDVEAGFNERELRQHIEKHGPDELYRVISYLSFQVFEAVRELNVKKDNQQEAKRPALEEAPVWVSGIDRFNADRLIGLLRKGDKFGVVVSFQIDGKINVLPGYDIEIFNIKDNSIDVWITSINNSFFPHTFDKSSFQYLITCGAIKQILPPPPVNETK